MENGRMGWPARQVAGVCIGIAVLVGLGAGCVSERSAVTGEKQFYGYSWSQELEIGAQTDQQLTAQLGVYDDEELQRYVNVVGQRVLAESDLRQADTPEMYREAPFTFRVVNSPVVNAFALPGGYVYVTRGLLTHLQNEAQLAVVLGHEIAHVAARHASRQAVKAQAGQLGLMAGAILGQSVFESGQGVQSALDVGGGMFQLLLMKYGRDAEREADQLGVQYAAQKGYRVEEAAGFFNSLDRISTAQGRAMPSWQSTHPDPGEREESIHEMARHWERPGVMNKVGQDDLFRHLKGVVAGADPREGFERNGMFYHPELRFQFPIPSGWNVQNERAVVLMIDPNRTAIMAFEIAHSESAAAAARTLMSQQGLQVRDSGPVNVNGLNAYRVLGSGQSSKGQVVILNYFIEQGGNVYSFLGYGVASQTSVYLDAFQRAMQGFGPLTDRGLLSVQPARIDIVRADRNAPFSEFVPGDLPFGLTREEVAIMNQIALEEIVAEGRVLKIPR